MPFVITEDDPMTLPTRQVSSQTSLAWPVCGRVVDVSGGPGGHALRCYLAHGHRGDCDDLGSAQLEHWRGSAKPVAPQNSTLDEVKVVAAAHARSYEAMAHWKRERGWRVEAQRLDSMADALRHLVQVIAR